MGSGGRLRWSIALVVAAGVLVALPARGTDRQPLPLPDLWQLVLDEGNQRLFYSAGRNHDLVLATDLIGNPQASLTGLDGASGMALSDGGASLWVTLPARHELARIDTAALTEVERVTLPADVCPGSVAVVDTVLVVGHSCNTFAGSGSYGGIGVLDPATGSWNPLEAPGPYYQPFVVSSPGSDGLVVAGDLGLSPTTLYTIGVIDGVADTVASRWNTGSNLRDLAMSPDGGLVAQAAGSPYRHDVFHVAGLGDAFSFITTNYPNAVAWSADGTIVATGTDSPYGEDVRLHRRDQPEPFASFELGDRLAPRGLALSGDGSAAFAVSGSGGDFGLHVLGAEPTIVASQLELAGAATTTVGELHTVTGTLTFADGSDAGGHTLGVARSYADVVEPLPDVVTGAGGQFSFTDVPGVATDITYLVAFAGEAPYAGSENSITVAVEKRQTELIISAARGSGKRDRKKVVVTAYLGETYTNRVVTITAQPQGSEAAVIATGEVGPDGTLTATQPLPRKRTTTIFTATFAGDDWYQPAAATVGYRR